LKRLCRSVGAPSAFFALRSFQLPLKIRKRAIWAPKMTAAVESDAANVLMDWFSLFSAAPVPVVGEDAGEELAVVGEDEVEELAVDDMFVCRPNAVALGVL
jgi:hypothetical protein